jgi:2-phosphosulfolactate phosphatase
MSTPSALPPTPSGALSGPHRPLRLDVALTPQWISNTTTATDALRRETVYIVIDVIRATTSLCVLFERGCREVLLASDVAGARALRDQLGPETLLAGEIDAVRPEGFDFGNSPDELARAAVAGRSIVFATTNGTRAIRACSGGRAILAGALRNAQAVAEAALAAVSAGEGSHTQMGRSDDEPDDIVVVCSGRDGFPAYDDTLTAGAIARRVIAAATERGQPVELEGGARIALATLAGVEASGGIQAALAESGAYQAIARIGLASDLAWCAATDVTAAVPRVIGHHANLDLVVMRASAVGG